MREKGFPWSYVIPLLLLIAVIGGIVYYYSSHQQGSSQYSVPLNTPQSLSYIPQVCDNPAPGACGPHDHVHFDIFVNGTQVTVPQAIGYTPNGLYALHTHDSSGVVHIESPTTQTYTCGQFCAVWGYPTCDSADCLTFHGQQVKIYVNGNLWTSGPISAIPLQQHDEIAILVGTSSLPTIPSSYQFPAGD